MTDHPSEPYRTAAETALKTAMHAHLAAICRERPDVYQAQHVAAGGNGMHWIIWYSPSLDAVSIVYSADTLVVRDTTSLWTAPHRKPERIKEVLTRPGSRQYGIMMPPVA